MAKHLDEMQAEVGLEDADVEGLTEAERVKLVGLCVVAMDGEERTELFRE